jgi:hypothetical protein
MRPDWGFSIIHRLGSKYSNISKVRCNNMFAPSISLGLVVHDLLFSVHGGDAHNTSKCLGGVLFVVPLHNVALMRYFHISINANNV